MTATRRASGVRAPIPRSTDDGGRSIAGDWKNTDSEGTEDVSKRANVGLGCANEIGIGILSADGGQHALAKTELVLGLIEASHISRLTGFGQRRSAGVPRDGPAGEPQQSILGNHQELQ